MNRKIRLALLVGLAAIAALTLPNVAPPARAPGPGVDYIIIQRDPSANGTWVANGTYIIGQTDTFWAVGYNQTSGYVGPTPAYWWTDNANAGSVSPRNWTTNTTFTAGPQHGIVRVWAYCRNPGGVNCTGTNGGQYVNATGSLTVLQAPITSIEIRDATNGEGNVVGDRTYYVGDTDAFYAAGYDANGSYAGDVYADWSVDNATACHVTTPGAPTTFSAVATGTCVATATFEGLSNTTGTLTILLHVGIDALVIQRDPSPNGTWVANGTYLIGNTDRFWAVGYNTTSGYVGPTPAYWWSDNANSGSVNPRLWVTNTTFTAGPQPGVVHIWAYCGPTQHCRYGGGTNQGVNNATGPLTVLQAPIASIEIRDAANGGGNVVGDVTYYVGDTDAFYAAGYDANGSYAGEVPADWSVDNATACQVTTPGRSTTFSAIGAGVCVVTATYGGVSNQTGNLTILARPTVYVDDDGVCGGNTPCFTTFTDALANASDGYYVIVYAGNYSEHVVVDKEVRIRGLDRYHIIVDGGGDGTVFLITANSVELSNLTIQEAKYAVFVDQANDTRIVYNLIRNYSYGLYFDRTKDAFTAWNYITTGQYGIVTDHVYNDAVRWNTIAYNTQYGAKDFDSTLRNCFNWNYFHHNHIAYWYDPDQPLTPFEFDGNVLENNDIGVRVTNGPALRLTNNVFRNNGQALVVEGSDLNVSANTFEGNGVAVEITGAAGNVTGNTFRGNDLAILCTDAATTIAANAVAGGQAGIACSGFSGSLVGNDLSPDGAIAVRLEGARDATVSGNALHGRSFVAIRSTFRDLAVLDSDVASYDTTAAGVELQGTSRLSEYWTIDIRTLAGDETPLAWARVEAYDRDGRLAAADVTDADGRLTLTLLQRTRTATGESVFAPYTVRAEAGGTSDEEVVAVEAPTRVTFILATSAVIPATSFPWVLAFGSVLALAIGGGLLSLEPLKVALLALFVPLFTRIGREDVLDDYTRGRVYQYVEMNPGDHFNSICRALGLGAGTVTYHMGVLERTGLVVPRTDHVYKRFYPRGVTPPETNGGTLSEVQLRIVHAVRDLPGITQKELARMMGLRASTVNYQMGRLAERGLVRAERQGRHVRYFPGEGRSGNA